MRIVPNMKLIAAIFLATLAGHALADELPYSNVEEAESFFNEKEHIALVVRINGGLSFGQYTRLRNEHGSGFSGREQETWQVWDREIKQPSTPESDYVVLKNFKGELGTAFRMPNDYANEFRLELGEPYVVFLDASTTNTYTLSTGQALPGRYFPPELLVQSDSEVLLSWLLTHLPFMVPAP